MDVRPFEIHVPDATLADLRERLAHARLPLDFANDDWGYGANRAYMEQLVAYYLDAYDWRAEEERMNRFDHFTTEIDGVRLHFLKVEGKGPDPAPLLLNHTNPLSWWDMKKLLEPLSDPVAHGGRPEDAFTVILPSLPGHGLSTPLTTPGIAFPQTAALFAQLMSGLGYERFFTAGGGWGAAIASQLGHVHPERVLGCLIWFQTQLSYYQPSNPDAVPGIEYEHGVPAASAFGPGEEGWHARNAAFTAREGGLQALIAQPQTLAYAMHDSPLGLWAWNVEKRRNWSDSGGDVESVFTKEELATALTLEWVGESFVTAARFYRETLLRPWRPVRPGMPVVGVPTSVLAFEHDVFRMPRRWSERYYDLRRYQVLDRGGYFAPMERPDAIVAELRAFRASLRQVSNAGGASMTSGG